MTSSSGKYAKKRGYDVEIQALKALSPIFSALKRVGSVGYSKSHADLEQLGTSDWKPLRLIVTKDKHGPLLVTLSVEDFVELVNDRDFSVMSQAYVQVKARATSWIGTLYRELKAATK